MILPYFNGERPLCNWSPTRVQPLATGYRTSSLKNIVFRSLMYSRVHLVNLERSNGVQHGSLKLLSRDAYAIPYVIIEYLPKVQITINLGLSTEKFSRNGLQRRPVFRTQWTSLYKLILPVIETMSFDSLLACFLTWREIESVFQYSVLLDVQQSGNSFWNCSLELVILIQNERAIIFFLRSACM
ncbi:uncharacterized protein [Malus domestica]|uniref:uncharacterized protein isoform X1 n=1 Tax=Malus domestica TaxID=3750 RepID=UPI003975FD5D